MAAIFSCAVISFGSCRHRAALAINLGVRSQVCSTKNSLHLVNVHNLSDGEVKKTTHHIIDGAKKPWIKND